MEARILDRRVQRRAEDQSREKSWEQPGDVSFRRLSSSHTNVSFLSLFGHFRVLSAVELNTTGALANYATEADICPSGMFRCPEGRCILSLRVCDYQKDCDKGEDEFQACRPVHTGDMRHFGRRILGSQVDAASQFSTVHTGR
uniref:Uncharacterized protein n=1 Tax=Timema shepardi TaxID=629360 RepID=A0A7R9AP47_TIMSH|nr:unnamed protein product [Timema shepardi]